MCVPLQIHRQRIGTFNQICSKYCNTESKKETYKRSHSSSLLIFLSLSLVFTFLVHSHYYQLTPSWPRSYTPYTTKSSQQTPCSWSGNLSTGTAWCSPMWTSPPWPSSLSSKFSNSLYSARSGQIVDVNFHSRYVNGNRRKNGIRMGHINLGSGFLVNRMNSIESIIGGYKPHILGVSETCIKKSHDVGSIQTDDYQVHFSKTLENEALNVSRVTVYTHKDLVVKERADLMNNSFSSVWLEVGLPRTKKILVCNLYRDWQYLDQDSATSLATAAQLSRWLTFIEQWETAIEDNKEIHVFGDTNIDFLKWNDPNQPGSHQKNRLNKLSHAIFDRIFPFGFVQLVTVPTRFWPGQQPSGLDHWYTNKPGKISTIQVVNQGGTDHRLIFGVRYSKSIIDRPKITKKRSYKKFNPNEFLTRIRSISWLDLYLCEDLEAATDIFTKKVTEILDEMAPIKCYQIRKNYAPWLEPDLKKSMVDRDEAQKVAQESNKNEDWKQFRKLRNSVNNKLKGAKTRWQKKKLAEYSSDSRSTWKHVRSWLGWSSGGPPSRLLEKGSLTSKPSEMARIMNSFFVDKVKKLRSNLPRSFLDPLIQVQNLMQQRSSTFQLRPVHPDEISKIISSLKSSKSAGMDEIDTYILKLAKEPLLPAITHLVNLSIRTKIFPKQWKLAKVIPLHKKHETFLPKNYRPVALLPVASKILERAVFIQVVNYFESNQLIHPAHHGFRSLHSTSTALLQMFDTWLEALEDHQLSAVIMLDLSAAFDVVDHDILLDKLNLYGVNSASLDWFRSYLSDRSQCVFVEGSLSEPLSLEAGVPQGSILGPLLYVLFTNDLPEAVHNHLGDSNTFFNLHCKSCGGICSFADDSTFTISRSDPTELDSLIDIKYQAIAEYMNANKLVLNSDKTHLLVMATPHQHYQNQNFGITLNTGAETIEPIYSEKLLGGHVTNDFKFNEHLKDSEKSAFKSLTSRVNALEKLSKVSPFKTRKIIANGIVMSKLVYLIQWWGGCSSYLMNYLQVLQTRAARVVTRSGWRASTEKLLHQCGWLSVRQLAHYHSLVLVFQIKQQGKPAYFREHFSAEFAYQTRLASAEGIRRNERCQYNATQSSFCRLEPTSSLSQRLQDHNPIQKQTKELDQK